MDVFTDKFINEKNFELLWRQINKIQKQYSILFEKYSVCHNEITCFYEQIQYIADMRWNGRTIEKEVAFGGSYSSIPKMDKEQFEYYMYYRTQMLEENYYIPRSLGYMYTFAYELSTGVETIEDERVEWILDYLIKTIKAVYTANLYGGNGDYGLTEKLSCWKPMIMQVYQNKKLGKQTEKIFSIQFDKTDLSLWENVSNYFIEESDFIKEFNLLIHAKEALKRICLELDKISLSDDVDIISCVVGGLEKKIDYDKFLPNSIWDEQTKANFLPKECTIIQYNPSHSERIDIVDDYGNTIRKMDIRTKDVTNNIALYVLKSIEVEFRTYTGYRSKLRKPKVDTSTGGIKTKIYEGTIRYYASNARKRGIQYAFLCAIPEILKTVDNVIDNYIADNKRFFDEVCLSVASKGMSTQKKRKQEYTDTKTDTDTDKDILNNMRAEVVDINTLQAARAVLHRNQERLVIEEETDSDSIMQQSINEPDFSKREIELLQILLEHGDFIEFEKNINASYVSVGYLVEKINEKAVELIGDIMIKDNEGKMELIEDYSEMCEKWVNRYGRN